MTTRVQTTRMARRLPRQSTPSSSSNCRSPSRPRCSRARLSWSESGGRVLLSNAWLSLESPPMALSAPPASALCKAWCPLSVLSSSTAPPNVLLTTGRSSAADKETKKTNKPTLRNKRRCFWNERNEKRVFCFQKPGMTSFQASLPQKLEKLPLSIFFHFPSWPPYFQQLLFRSCLTFLPPFAFVILPPFAFVFIRVFVWVSRRDGVLFFSFFLHFFSFFFFFSSEFQTFE